MARIVRPHTLWAVLFSLVRGTGTGSALESLQAQTLGERSADGGGLARVAVAFAATSSLSAATCISCVIGLKHRLNWQPRVLGGPESHLNPHLPSYHANSRSEKASPGEYSYSIWIPRHRREASRRSAAETSADATPVPCADGSTERSPQWPQPRGVQGACTVEEHAPRRASSLKARCRTRLDEAPASPISSRRRTSHSLTRG
mmetsp:Transcript_15498/g.35625  ORF Transcript_15498/g.35625 Transcript_15498/m.35625 type:complete len:203 (+) Transcript_15498:568-1176(+)